VLQDYRQLNLDQLEALEKQALRMIVQALQEYSREAKDIFENTKAPKSEVIVLGEDIVQYALEVAECYPINKRFAGFIDYKRVRWMPTPYGVFPQVLLADAKASTENTRDTLQQSQLPMDAEFCTDKQEVVQMAAGVRPHLEIQAQSGNQLLAVTTSSFIHFYYQDLDSETAPYRELKAIYSLLLPHQLLKQRYNPNPDTTFFGQGKHSPAREEEPRIRVYFSRLRQMQPWRLQELKFTGKGVCYADPVWRDSQAGAPGGPLVEVTQSFEFIGR
jgi:hypothetical protein